MAPIQFDDKILVLMLRAHQARRFATGYNHAVMHSEGARRHGDWDPAGQVLAIEQ